MTTEWLDTQRDNHTASHRVETLNRLLQCQGDMHIMGELHAWMALLHLEFGMAVTATETKQYRQALHHLAECHRPLEEARVRVDRTMLSMPETQEYTHDELRIMAIDVEMQQCVAEGYQAYAIAHDVSNSSLPKCARR